MKKHYQVVTTSTRSYDEWIHYDGEDLEKAKDVANYGKRHIDKNTTVEIREYELKDNEVWSELDEDKKCIIRSSFNTIDID